MIDARFIDAEAPSSCADDVVEVGDPVHEAQGERLLGGVDAPVGERSHALLGHLPRFGDEPNEAAVHVVDDALEDLELGRVRGRNGEPASFIGPDLMASGATPIFSMRPCALTVSMTTPRLPVTEVGWTTMVSAASAT